MFLIRVHRKPFTQPTTPSGARPIPLCVVPEEERKYILEVRIYIELACVVNIRASGTNPGTVSTERKSITKVPFRDI